MAYNECKHKDIRAAIFLNQVNYLWKFFKLWNHKNYIVLAQSLDVCNGGEVIAVFSVSFERYARQQIIRWLYDTR